jgi:uncharacterized protein
MVSILTERRNEIADVCARFGVRRLEVFGSAATNDFDPRRSDVDLIVEFQEGHDLGPWMEQYFSLQSSLASLLGRPVDLVIASAMKNPYFIREANRTRQLLYGN